MLKTRKKKSTHMFKNTFICYQNGHQRHADNHNNIYIDMQKISGYVYDSIRNWIQQKMIPIPT
jgi:hypothetical protein